MGYKTILAVLDSEKSAKQISNFAIDLAEQLSAHVIGLHSESVASMPLVAPMEIPDPIAVQAMQDIAHGETQKIKAVFEEASRREGVSTEWRSFLSSAGFGTAFLESTRTADLIIAAQGEDGSASENRSELESVLFESGRPVLLVPFIYRQPRPIRRVLIAWNGSKEAARATFDALPFLERADKVEVYCVVDQDDAAHSKSIPGADIATTLARHGVNVTVVTEDAQKMKAAHQIENRLSDESIDLLVMGAYSHKRWWEVMFGGVTRTVLDSMTALTLLSR